MNWLNLNTSTKTAPAFVGCEPTQRATWLCLMLYCSEHENGGVIRDCAGWGTRRWMQTCGVTKDEVLSSCDLWSFDGGDLSVWGYPVEREREVAAKREGGRAGGISSGKTRREKIVLPAMPEAQLKAELQGELQAKPERNGKEGNGKEGNGKEIKTVPDGLSVGIGDVGDKYERIRSIPQKDLAQWAVRFCGDDLSWTRVYKAYVDKIGPEAFRAILEQFVGEVDSGEDGRVRGSVLVAKLKKALAEKHGGSGSAGN